MAYARGLAEDVASSRLDIEAVHRMPDDEALELLIRIKGIGRWSAEIYLLLVLGRSDIWPVDDLAVAVGLQWLLNRDERPPRDELVALGEPWRPYRSTAARLVGIITFRWRRSADGRKHCHSSGSLFIRCSYTEQS